MDGTENKKCSKRTLIGLAGCVGGMFIHLILGSIYQWGIINIYVASYYKKKDPSVTLESNAMVFPIIMFCTGITVTPGLYIAQKINPLIVMLIVEVLQAVCIFASSFAEQIGVFVALYGVIFGVISGFNFMIPIVECNKYFPGRRMYVNGFILTGTGIGPLIFGMFSYNSLNPNKVPHNKGYYYGSQELEEIAVRVPECLRWLSLFYIIIGIVGCLLLIGVCQQNKRAEQSNTKHQNNEISNENIQSNNIIKDNKNEGSKEPEVIINEEQPNSNMQFQKEQPRQISTKGQASTLKQAVCTKVFWIQVLILFCSTCGTLLLNVNYKTYVKYTINDDQFLTIIGVVGSIGSGFSRFLWNVLFNHTGYRLVMIINLCIQIVVFSIIRFSVDNPGFYLVMILLNNISFGGCLVMTPTFSQIVFGPIVGSKVYGIYTQFLAISNLVQFAYVVGLVQYITFNGVIYICLGKSVFALFLVIFSNFQGPWKNPTRQLGYYHKFIKQQKL